MMSQSCGKKIRVGLIGARGYVGAELIRLIEAHKDLDLVLAVSREWAGTRVCDALAHTRSELAFENLTAEQIATREYDALFLALPNEKSFEIMRAIEHLAPQTIVIDLSADHRFDSAWAYGQPETNRDAIKNSRRISNPGCYATAMLLALTPIAELLADAPSCFGVSGYSGAGTTPSDKNDPENLRDNLIPYRLIDHLHEREVTRHLQHRVEFMPHVAGYFRGITMTINAHLRETLTRADVLARYSAWYAHEPLISLREPAPLVNKIVARHGVEIGGIEMSEDGKRLVIVACLDNLLKGAATQAMQNLNLALGLPELQGIDHE